VADQSIPTQRRARALPPAIEPKQPPARPAQDAAQASSQLDTIIHERTRLGIAGALAARGRLSFAELKGILRTTDGNLSAHARKLEDAGYLRSIKRFEGRMPRTEYELTEAGLKALQGYLDHMEALIRTMRPR
jgi:DNA-binding MarR family transcriptional regulator